ncbi:MAG: serine hydrolase [Chloroflexi bacterium]|nr:serine hydrolase [Chloroflexota bacterium]
MELRTGTAQAAGVRPEVTSLLRRRAEAWVTDGRNPSIVLLAARGGVTFFHEAFGVSSPEGDSPALTIDALFPLASLTKPFTATAVMILVEEGKLGLNRPVQEYLPEFVGEDKEQVMVHHLLTHTSGVSDDEFEKVLESLKEGLKSVDVPKPDETQTLRIARILALTYNGALLFEPGSQMSYSDLGIYLAGEIVRRISGQSLANFYRERIYEPLGMDSSFMIVPEDQQNRVVSRPDDAPGAIYHDVEWMEHPSPSGGMYSTAEDVARFGQMLLNGGNYGDQRILSPAAVAAMTRNQIPGISAKMLDVVFPEASWGLGLSVGHPFKGRVYGEALPTPDYFSHGGYGGVEMWVDPENKIVGAYFSVALDIDEIDFTRHHCDLFMNMVTSAAQTDGVEVVAEERSNRDAEVSEVQVQPLRTGSPEEAGADPARVDNLIQTARSWVDEGTHPALVILAARKGIVFLHEAFGEGEGDSDLTVDALFPLASITKPITATAIMVLAERGLLGLSRPVRDYISEFEGENKEKVLVRNLLTHTSGLTDERLYETAEQSGIKVDPTAPLEAFAALMGDYEQLLRLTISVPLSSAPNSVMTYSDANFNLLGEIVRRVSGMSLPQFAHENIFEPLGLQNTVIAPTKPMRSRVVERPTTAPAYDLLEAALTSAAPSGSAGGFGTAMDMAIFGQMFLNRGAYGDARILSPASTDAMTRNQIPGIPAGLGDESWPEAGWGFGWSIHEAKKSPAWNELLPSPGSYDHGGSGGVFLLVDPALDLVACFFSVQASMNDRGLPNSNTDLFINAVLGSITEV